MLSTLPRCRCPRQTLDYTAGIIRRHRKRIGSCWRKLNPGLAGHAGPWRTCGRARRSPSWPPGSASAGPVLFVVLFGLVIVLILTDRGRIDYHRDAVTGYGISDAFRDAEFLAVALDRGLGAGAEEAAALTLYQQQRDQALREIFEITCRLAAYPAVPAFIELQKQLSAAIDEQAAAGGHADQAGPQVPAAGRAERPGYALAMFADSGPRLVNLAYFGHMRSCTRCGRGCRPFLAASSTATAGLPAEAGPGASAVCYTMAIPAGHVDDRR